MGSRLEKGKENGRARREQNKRGETKEGNETCKTTRASEVDLPLCRTSRIGVQGRGNKSGEKAEEAKSRSF